MTPRPLALFHSQSVSMVWDSGTLLSSIKLMYHPDEQPEEGRRLYHVLDHLRLRGWRYTREWGSARITAPYPVTLPQLYRTTMEAVGHDVAREDDVPDDSAWRLEVAREVMIGLQHLWSTYQCLMTHMSHQTGCRSLYAQGIYCLTADPFRRWIQVYRYEADEERTFVTSLRNLSKSISVDRPVGIQWYFADDFLRELYYRCVQDVGKLQSIHDQLVRDST